MFSELGLLRNPQTWEPYKLVELDLGNTQLSNGWTGGGNGVWYLFDFPGLVRLNLAGNAITEIFALGVSEFDPNTGMTRPRFNRLAELDVSNNQITEVFSLQTLRTLKNLNLLDNNNIRCADLDMLTSVLNTTTVQRPASCVP
jgi:Leucine-rich repeat (LRR) protein